jgi:hypothetical protein
VPGLAPVQVWRGMCNEQGGGAYFAVADRLWRVDRAGPPCTTVCKLPGTLLLKGVAKIAVPSMLASGRSGMGIAGASDLRKFKKLLEVVEHRKKT